MNRSIIIEIAILRVKLADPPSHHPRNFLTEFQNFNSYFWSLASVGGLVRLIDCHSFVLTM